MRDFLASAPLTDGHNDLPWAHRDLAGYDLDAVDIGQSQPRLHTDIPRLRKGGVGAQFWSVYVPASMAGDAAVTATLEQIAFVRAMVARYPDDFGLATSADDVYQAVHQGRIACLLGMEGGHSINESLKTLECMAELGVRYMTLTHNDNVSWADSATDEPILDGMNEFGEQVVATMNRIGMAVDLSHVSADTMRHALRVTAAPVMFSHSSARAVCDVPRNVPDDVLESVPSNGGVVMVTFVPQFVSPECAEWYRTCLEITRERGLDPRNFAEVHPVMAEYNKTNPVPTTATLDQVVRHIEHVRDAAGIDHIGIGGDYDGTLFVTQGLEDVSCYPALFEALADRGWSREDLGKLAGGNAMRVLRAVEDCRA